MSRKEEAVIKAEENKLINYVKDNLEIIDEIKDPREKSSKIVDVVKQYFTEVYKTEVNIPAET